MGVAKKMIITFSDPKVIITFFQKKRWKIPDSVLGFSKGKIHFFPKVLKNWSSCQKMIVPFSDPKVIITFFRKKKNYGKFHVGSTTRAILALTWFCHLSIYL